MLSADYRICKKHSSGIISSVSPDKDRCPCAGIVRVEIIENPCLQSGYCFPTIILCRFLCGEIIISDHQGLLIFSHLAYHLT
jgi:hypothetical protein